MNRNIKFRVWDKKRSGFLHKIEEDCDIIYSDDRWYILGGYKLDNRYIMQQFTELFDKNGVEIFEGDLLLEDMTEEIAFHGGSSSLSVVKFSCGSFMIDCEPLYNYIDSKNPEKLPEFKVIGNIFENKNFLK